MTPPHRHLVPLLASLAAMAALMASAAPAPLASGAYEEALLIGYDPASGVVSGYFDMTQGEQPSFSCVFYLKGRISGGAAAIDTYFPQTPADDLIKGTLKLGGAGKLTIVLPTEHGGCANVWQFASKDQPAEFTLAGAHPWTSVRVVKAAKAYFYVSPGAADHGRAYLVQGDGVGVRATQAGWLQVDYVGGARPISGWVKAADLYPGG
ncbi:MAG: hypothetical protein ACHP7N_01075 [Caulobacterales bacterium]